MFRSLCYWIIFSNNINLINALDRKITSSYSTSSRRMYSDQAALFDDSPNSRLNDELLHRHRQKFRPVRNPNDTLLVYVLAALYQIVDVNQKSNLVGVSAYFDLVLIPVVTFAAQKCVLQGYNKILTELGQMADRQSKRKKLYILLQKWWYDEFLTWKPDDFNGANETYLPAVDVWVPDLYLYHSVEGSTPLLVHQSAVQIDFMGRVRLFVPFTAKALCTINVKYFPFDTQVCQFQFGSWSFREHHIQYVVASSEVTLHEFFDNQEWYLVRCNLTSNRSRYANGNFNETYSTVRLTVELERGSFYYIFNLIIPTTLVTIVSVIGFHASANSTERRESKFRLGIMTLLSMGVLLLNVVNDMPKFSMVSVVGNRGSFSDAPILGLYYLSLIIIVSFCTCTSCLFVTLETYALHHQQNVPFCFRFLLLRWLPRRLRFGDGSSSPFGPRRVSNDENLDVRTTTKIKNGNEYNAVDVMVDNGHAGADKKSALEMEKIKYDDGGCCEISSSPDDDLRNLAILRQIVPSIFQALRQMKKDYLEMNIRLSTMNKKQQQPNLLTEDWDKVICRIEFLSLAFYLIIIFTCCMLFFHPSWY